MNENNYPSGVPSSAVCLPVLQLVSVARLIVMSIRKVGYFLVLLSSLALHSPTKLYVVRHKLLGLVGPSGVAGSLRRHGRLVCPE